MSCSGCIHCQQVVSFNRSHGHLNRCLAATPQKLHISTATVPLNIINTSTYCIKHQRSSLVVVCQAAAKGFGSTSSTTAKPKKLSKEAACPCGSGTTYKECCQKYHTGGDVPPTAEVLMRSRYSAYAKGLVNYVVETTHPDNPLAKSDSNTLEEDVRATCNKITWDKLIVLSNEDGASPDEAFVTFKTYFKVKGQQGQRAQGWHTQSFTEKSRFLKDPSGKWLYVDGHQDWTDNNTL